MIDGFALLHRRVRLNGRGGEIRNVVIQQHVYKLCRGILEPIPLELFEKTRLAEPQARHVEIHLEHILPRISDLEPAEQRLMEIVALHRLKNDMEHTNPKTGAITRCIAITGAMIQDRLTLLLLDLEPGMCGCVFGLCKMRGINPVSWQTEFLGAAAVTRVIRALCKVNDTEVCLPTIHEDVDIGIDLFAADKELHTAISVKSIDSPRLMTVECLFSKPNGQPSIWNNQRAAIFKGAETASSIYGKSFTPVRVLVGRNGTKPYDVRPHGVDVDELKRLFRDSTRQGYQKPARYFRPVTAY